MNAGKARVFISYSHRGNGPEWKAALLRGLHVFEQHHLLDVWQDGKIRVSSFWDDDIKQAMSNAQLAVVLLTKEALESEYIVDTEFPFLRERQQRDKLPVFPVICEECDWRAHDWLRATQSPNESNPISLLTEAAQEGTFRRLATNIADELSRVALEDLPKTNQPLAPDHIYLDKFPLTQGSGPRKERLIGREQELALLDLAFAQPHTAIASLVAWGGVGKTMLVQHWLQRLAREGWFGARRVYAWSFYSQGTKEDRQSSEDTFLAHALEWFGVQCEPTLSPWDKGRLLADAVARERTLLILDGIEPLQYPPGPMGGQLRAPGVQSLLKQLARNANDTEHRGLCLVTTREPLTDLADFQRRPDVAWGSVLRIDLGNLNAEAGAALLHHAGAKRAGAAEIKSDDAELFTASREVDGHALTLNLLGRFLARAHGGDIRRRDLVKFEEADREEQGGTTFKMLAAFENWFARSGDFGARQLAVLRMLGLFDRPADAGCIAALRKPPAIDGLTDSLFIARKHFVVFSRPGEPLSEEDWNTATSFLAEFGLIVIQPDPNNRERTLDCHPLIREHFAKRLYKKTHDSWRSAHSRLYSYLSQTTEQQPDSLADLQPLYQAVSHGSQAGLYQEALDKVYFARIHRGQANFAIKHLGAFGTDLTALSCFFVQPWTQLVPDLKEGSQAWVFLTTSVCLRALGRLNEAVEPVRVGLQMRMRQENWMNAAIAANNLSEMEVAMGDLASAMRDAEQSVTLADRTGDGFLRSGFRTMMADALHQTGRCITALESFRQAEVLQAERQPEYQFLYSTAGFRYCDLLLDEPERVAWQSSLRKALLDRREPASLSSNSGEQSRLESVLEHCQQVVRRSIAISGTWSMVFSNSPTLLDIGLDRLTVGRAALCRAVLDVDTPNLTNIAMEEAHQEIFASVQSLFHSGNMTHIPRGLLTRAWLRSLEGDADGARADLDEAWEIAERGPMRLHLADIHLHRARLFFREQPYPWKSAPDDLAAAERLINDCGYHRRDEELADARRAILGEGAPNS